MLAGAVVAVGSFEKIDLEAVETVEVVGTAEAVEAVGTVAAQAAFSWDQSLASVGVGN